MKIKDYKFSFGISAAVLFAIVMLPNIIWAFAPSQNDILRNESQTQVLDVFATVFQVLMIATLCILKNKNASKLCFSPFIICTMAFCVLYYLCWILYYCQIARGGVILGMCIFPCLTFVAFCADRKNYIALAPAIVFFALHLASTIINFL